MKMLFTQIKDAQHNVDVRMLGPKTPNQLADIRNDQLVINDAHELMIRRGAVAVQGLISNPVVAEEAAMVPAQVQARSQNLTNSSR